MNLARGNLKKLHCSVCHCHSVRTVNVYSQFTQDPKKKHGFSLSLQLQYASCRSVFSDCFTSSLRAGTQHVHHLFKVNDQFLLFLREVGLGLAALNKFCAVFGIKPRSKKSVSYHFIRRNRTGLLM